MMDMMQQCWNWMISLGVFGMLLGFVVLAAVVALMIWLISRFSAGKQPPS